jgi:hypothetical protein
MTLKNLFFILFVIFGSLSSFSKDLKKEWDIVSVEDNFTTKRSKVSGRSVYAFRGEVLADVPISKVISVFLNRKLRKEWVNLFKKQKDLQIESELNKIYWIRFNLPFFLLDRDYVLHLKGNIDEDKKVITANIKSVLHKDKGEEECCVRAEAFGTFYRFEARGKKTYLEVEVNTDPKGWIPSWIVNIIQEKWPKKTLGKLISVAKRSDIKPDERFVGWERD